MATILIERENENRISVKFGYQPEIVDKIKRIEGRNWNIRGKYWTLPNTETIIEQFFKVFESDQIFIDKTLSPIFETNPQQLKDYDAEISQILKDLDRELTIKGYSIKTRKAYRNNIRRYLQYCPKKPREMNEADIKEYLL